MGPGTVLLLAKPSADAAGRSHLPPVVGLGARGCPSPPGTGYLATPEPAWPRRGDPFGPLGSQARAAPSPLGTPPWCREEQGGCCSEPNPTSSESSPTPNRAQHQIDPKELFGQSPLCPSAARGAAVRPLGEQNLPLIILTASFRRARPALLLSMLGTPDTRPQKADGEGRAAATAPRRAPTSAPRCPRPQAGLSAPPRGRQLGTGRRVAGQGRGAGGRSPLFLHRGAVLPFVALPEERVHRVPGRRRRRAPPALRCRREALSRDGGGRRGGGWGWRLERGWREAGRRLEAASCPPGAAGEGHGRGWAGAGPGGGSPSWPLALSPRSPPPGSLPGFLVAPPESRWQGTPSSQPLLLGGSPTSEHPRGLRPCPVLGAGCGGARREGQRGTTPSSLAPRPPSHRCSPCLPPSEGLGMEAGTQHPQHRWVLRFLGR